MIAEIYNHYIRNTVVTFEETPISGEEIARRIEVVEAASLPWLVAEVGGQVRGYAYAGRWSPRSGYRHSAETAVYLDRAFPRRGLGTALYTELFALLRDRGFHADNQRYRAAQRAQRRAPREVPDAEGRPLQGGRLQDGALDRRGVLERILD